jgi:hypothetical protein
MSLIEEWINYTQESEAPTSYHIAACLSCIAGVLERKVWIKEGFGNLFANSYFVLVGAPAVRKTAAMKFMRDILEKIKGVAIAPDGITQRRLYTEIEDSTKFFSYQGKEFPHASYNIIADEWAFFMGERDIKFITALIKLYDCQETFKYFTQHEGENIVTNTWVNMIGGIQPEVISTVIPVQAIGSGFTSRIIFVFEETPRHLNPDPNFPVDKQKAILEKLQSIYLLNGEWKKTPEAQQWYNEWYLSKNRNIINDKRFESYLHRKPQHLLKLALLFSISRTYGKSLNIEVIDMQTAKQWLDEIELKMPMVYGSFGLSSEAGIVHNIMHLIRQHKEMAKADIVRAIWRDGDHDKIEKAIITLSKMKTIKILNSTDGIRLKWLGEK